jgi:hypothetical protein
MQSTTPTYRVWYRQNRLGRFAGTFKAFLKKYGQRPDSFYLFNLEKGWIFPSKFQTKKPSQKKRRKFRHGKRATVEFYAYHNQKKNGCNLSFKEFLEVYGLRPGPGYRFCKGKGWIKKEMKLIWVFLTSDEILKVYEEIKIVCKRGSYDYDEAVTVLFADLNLAKADEPLKYALTWVRRYLPKIMSTKPKFVSLLALGKEYPEYNQELLDND